MNRGRVVQTGAPLEVYSQPADTFVASFLGSPANLLAARIDGESIVLGDTRLPLAGALATVARSAPSREVIVGIRPEDIGFGGSDAQVQADVLAVEQLGAETILRLQLPGVIDEVLMHAGRQVDVRSGTRVRSRSTWRRPTCSIRPARAGSPLIETRVNPNGERRWQTRPRR